MEDVVILSSVAVQTVLMSALINRRFGKKNRKNRNHTFSGESDR